PARVLVLVDRTVLEQAKRAGLDVGRAPGGSQGSDSAFEVRASVGEGPRALSAAEADSVDVVVLVSAGETALEEATASERGGRPAARGARPLAVVLRTPLPPAPSRSPPLPRYVRKPRVLYVEGSPRWEFSYVSNSLTRDENLLAHVWLVDADENSPQK